MNEWNKTTVGIFCPFTYGKSLPENYRINTGDVPVYGSNGIVGFHNEALAQEPGIVIGRKGTVGAVHYSKKAFWAIDTAFYVVSDTCRDLRYSYYLLKSIGLEQMNSDSAVPGLNRNAAHEIELNVPPLAEQKAIASVLSSLDDKIDLLHRQNATLEKIAETIFRQWFIEEAKDGWETKPLSFIADFLNGLACQKYPPKNDVEKLPVLKIKDLSNGISENSDWASTKVKPEFIVTVGDVIFAWSASLMVKIWNGPDCILNQHLFKVTSTKYPKWYYYLWCKHHLAVFIAKAASQSTTMGHIKRRDLDEALVLEPKDAELDEMSEIINPLFNKLVSNYKKIKTLTVFRDTLLPKLMSGEVRIKT